MPTTALRRSLVLVSALALGACASLGGGQPLRVSVSGAEPLPGQGMELRMLLKLRVQNPTDTPLEYDGISVDLDVQGRDFASGVSGETGSVPRFGEAVIAVPVTISALSLARQVMGMLDGKPVSAVRYTLDGRLSSPGIGFRRFSSAGDLDLPQL